MSATARHTPLVLPGARTPATATSLTIAWPISPRALIAAPPAAALLNGHAAKLAACSLVWTIDGPTASAALHLTLTSGQTDVLPFIESAPAALTSEPGLELVHIDVRGVLQATLRLSDHRLDVLYARTTLLAERLALPGGVYDAPSLNPMEAIDRSGARR